MFRTVGRLPDPHGPQVGVSFGAERELAFLHAHNGSRIYFPQTNGMLFRPVPPAAPDVCGVMCAGLRRPSTHAGLSQIR